MTSVQVDKILGDVLMHDHKSADILDLTATLDPRYVKLDQSTPQTVGDTTNRLLKLWATDITVTNAITGAVTGNAGTVTNGVYTNAANSMSLINPLTTIAESWIGPSSTTGIYFKGGNVGIGTTAPTKKLHIEDTSNNTYTLYAHNTTTNNDVGTVYLPAGLFSELDSTNNNAAVSSQYSSIYSTLRYRGSHSLDNNANRAVNGIFNSVFNYNTGTTDWVSGFYTDIRNLGTSSVYGDITNLAVYRAITPALSGGTVTNAYGMYLDGMYTSGRTTNAYGIYQAGASDKNYFAGNVGIGTTAPLSQLNLDTGSVAAGLYNGILVNGTNPGMGLRVDRSSGGAAAKLLRMYLRNTSSTNETQMGAIGFFGTAGATPTVDYVWIGADTNSEYNLASFRVYKEYIQSTRIHGLFFKPTADGTAAFRFVTNASETGYLLVGDTTNMRVSINGATPLATLDVRGSASGITSIFKAHATTPGDLTQWQNSSGTVLACVTGTGNVGIGTTGPQGKLDVAGTMFTSDYAYFGGTVNTGLRLKGTDNTNAIYQHTGSMGLTVTSGNAITFNSAVGTEAMRIINGNVGIGTTAPDARLHVLGATSGITAVFDAGATTPSDILQLRNSSESVLANFSATGELGIGVASSTLYKMRMAGTNYATLLHLTSTTSGTASTSYVGIGNYFTSGNVYTSGVNYANYNSFTLADGASLSQAYGMRFDMQGLTGNGSTSSIFGALRTGVDMGAGWTGTLGVGSCLFGRVGKGGGTITTSYGLWFEYVQGTTTAHGIYIGDVTATTANAIVTNAGNIVFNEGGDASTDIRMESDTEANMFWLDANGNTNGTLYIGGNSATTSNSSRKGGLFFPVQAPTASAPAYVKGAIYFDTTLNKLMVGGATAWETVTSV